MVYGLFRTVPAVFGATSHQQPFAKTKLLSTVDQTSMPGLARKKKHLGVNIDGEIFGALHQQVELHRQALTRTLQELYCLATYMHTSDIILELVQVLADC